LCVDGKLISASIQVKAFDSFGNLPTEASGGLIGFVSQLYAWNEMDGSRALVASLPLKPYEPGIVRAQLPINNTGAYLVDVFLGNTQVPGSGYNMTAFPGPPDARNSVMQVCLFCSRALHCRAPFQ
jgi:hypothetical protein